MDGFRTPRRRPLIWVLPIALGMAAIGSVLELTMASPNEAPVSKSEPVQGIEETPADWSDPLMISGPNAWTVDLPTARTQAAFALRLPNTALANRANLTRVDMSPGGHSVFLEFPAPPNAEDTRQSWIEVFEAVWDGGDPQTEFRKSIENNPDPVVGESLCTVGTLPAVCVEPNSPSDVTGRNPAYVQFVQNGVEFEVSGGTDLEAVLDIANSLLAQ